MPAAPMPKAKEKITAVQIFFHIFECFFYSIHALPDWIFNRSDKSGGLN